MIVGIPFFIEWISDSIIFNDKKGSFDSWLSFLGSYIGGIASGITTLLGIYIGIQYEKSNQKKHAAIANREDVKALYDWCFSVKIISENIESDFSKVDNEQNNNINKKARELEVKISKVDYEWYQKLSALRKKYSDATWNIKCQKGDEKEFRDIIKNLDNFVKELSKYI
ncbi:hypothetical protein [Lysinibacillus sp. RC79]|uniref:hypothetical protein n=1 Tax=Lysinibacillus sp. RC79 TaxID=3156296 RepID=UPI0035185B46